MAQAAALAKDYQALNENAAFIDFSNRGRLCLVGADRQAFINGQVTNNVKGLRVGQGCYTALANAKGKMTSDLNIFVLADEILLDFESGLAAKISERLEKYIIADDVQIVDASTSFGLISVLGLKAISLCEGLGWRVPKSSFGIELQDGVYVGNLPRLGTPGVDLYFPLEGESPVKKLKSAGIEECTVDAFEMVRIEQGIPRFGIDMDENTLAPEALGENAISYAKGCYIGQEVIARIRTYGQVAKALRGIRFELGANVPPHGEKIFHEEKEVGWVTSAVYSPKLERPIALGYVRKECNQIGTVLVVNNSSAQIVATPFEP
ncbi:MAG: CAF17-like 4Fe-4S cluster assembly/insertion protein YgfZ [Limisphaerales bacterium]